MFSLILTAKQRIKRTDYLNDTQWIKHLEFCGISVAQEIKSRYIDKHLNGENLYALL